MSRDFRDFGWEIAHGAVSRRPPVSLDTSVACTKGYTHAAQVWDMSIVQGPFSVARAKPMRNDSNFCIAVRRELRRCRNPKTMVQAVKLLQFLS
jgi:hypothetical protein